MGKFQMENDKLTLGGIIGVGVLATSLVIGSDVQVSTYATMLEPESYLNSENPNELILGKYPDYQNSTPSFSFKYDKIKIGMDIDGDDYPEVDVIEVPVAKRMIFQFNKPVKLEFF